MGVRVHQGHDLAISQKSCQTGTLVHLVHGELHPHVTLRHLLTHRGCVYNRSL